MRCSLLSKQKKYDLNVNCWIWNSGSYAWLTEDRLYPNASCQDFDSWPYGLGGNSKIIPKYSRKDVVNDKQAVIDRFRSRKVHYAFGLLDKGPGDTLCQVNFKGMRAV